MRKKYIVQLKEAEHSQLREVVTKGKAATYKIKHANILLAADAKGPTWQDEAVARVFSVNLQMEDILDLYQHLYNRMYPWFAWMNNRCN